MTRYESIRRLEELLEEQISASQGSPFIAHCDAPAELEEAALRELVECVGGSLPVFLRLMRRFPCVCTRAIATALAESYGSEGAGVYGLIAKCLRVKTMMQRDHRALHDRFVESCEALGLALPPAGRMVDSYLFQAGISRHQLPRLAHTFLKAERVLGLPRSHDTREVDDWEDRAVRLAPPGLRVLRRIVRGDPTGYHGTTFARLRKPDSFPISSFERVFQAAIQSPSTSASKGHSAVDVGPDLQFTDGDLWIAIPQRADRLEVRIRGRIHPLSRGSRFALPSPWPAAIEWRRPNAEDPGWRQLGLFADYRRILVFDGDTGLQKGDLDPTRSKGQRLPAGQLCLISQTAFAIDEEPALYLGVDAFLLFCDISTETVLHQRDLRCVVGVEARLRMEVRGEKVVRNRDGWLLGGPISARIHGRGQGSAETLEVRVRHPALADELRCAVQSTSDGHMAVELGMPETGDFGLAQASLHIRDQRRALYRTVFWYWPGLHQLLDERLFIAGSIPDNLAEDQLSHISRDGRGHLVVLEGKEPYLRARLCFRVGHKLATFSLPPPGPSVSVRTADGAERSLKVGASLAVRDDYASSLIVRHSDPMAAIDLRGQVIRNAFGKTGSWRVSFATLRQEGKHNRVRLLVNERASSGRNLVQIVPEAEPRFFRVQRRGTQWYFDAAFELPIDAVRIVAENLIGGESRETNLAVASPSDHPDDSPLATLVPTTAPNSFRIAIDQNGYPEGVWFINFEIREEGREEWLPLIDASGQSYATCIASDVYSQALSSKDISEWCPVAHRAQAFLRLCQAIETPIARPCRPHVVNLALDAWWRVGKALDASEASHRNSLMSACALPRASHALESWIPVHHPVEVRPDLFAVPAEDIGELVSSEAAGYQDFESVGLAGITESLQDAVELLDIGVTFLIAFEKASELQKDPSALPGAFDFSKYCRDARALQDMVEDDKPLSVWHHDRACERMADRMVIASRDRFSLVRLAKSTIVVRRCARFWTEAVDVPRDLAEEFPLVQGTPRLIAALTEAWRNEDADTFWRDLAGVVGWPTEKVRKHVGTVLRLAPELLAFYLLLWVLGERHGKA